MRRTSSVVLAVFLGVLAMAPRVAAGQTAPAAPAPPRPLERNIIVLPGDIDERRAEDIRRAFQEVMRRYPPALGRVLKLDPTLLTNQAYLAPYPALAEFLRLHPEVARYSGYFLSYVSENGNSWEPQDADQRVRSQALDMWRSMIGDLGAFSVFLVVTAALVWLVKYFVGHRRWLRTTKVQSEVHNRLLERFSSNDELMAYVQSPAGEHFLQAMPVAIESSDAPALAAPLSRILWSVQVGLVLAAGGIGMLIIRDNLIEEVSQMLMVLGTLAISLGIGFSLAALASYLLSSRLGLLNRPTPGPRGDAPLG